MKPISPHDAFDDLIAAALHGELTPEERTQFESRLQTDPAAQAAYQEAQAMHDMLDKNYKAAQPDPAFEQRMVSGVRRKIQHEQHRETAWESLHAVWAMLRQFPKRFRLIEVAVVLGIIAVLAGVALGPITNGIKQAKHNPAMQLARQKAQEDYQAQIDAGVPNPVMKSVKALPDGTIVEYNPHPQDIVEFEAAHANRKLTLSGANTYTGRTTENAGTLMASARATTLSSGNLTLGASTVTPQGGTVRGSGFNRHGFDGMPAEVTSPPPPVTVVMSTPSTVASGAPPMGNTAAAWNEDRQAKVGEKIEFAASKAQVSDLSASLIGAEKKTKSNAGQDSAAPTVTTQNGQKANIDAVKEVPAVPAAAEAPALDTRKLIRNAQLELEVKSFQSTMDQITVLTKSAGGYVDTSNSQKGGNGKLQGTVVVKVLPQNLDAFLLKLRDLGQIKNQSVSTDDVTKAYFDTQARLDNSRRMETQLQDLLKHANSKVSDLLQVERELGRVRGEIEQMQGQLKLYDFQVQYATVTMQVREKDLNQAAAYLLKEQDQFSLFATDVEGTFQKARQTADDFKAQILAATLNHNSGSDVSAELVVMVAPDQIEPFLAQIRSLGRVANFTRQTQRVAKDGGDSDEPADQTLTEKDKVQVHLAIRSDDETRKQVALTVVAKAVDDALDQAKTAALAQAGAEILSSSLNKTPQGQSTAQLTVRVPGKDYSALIAAFNSLGRTASLSIQRNDNSGPGANGDDAPVIVSLALTDDDTPLQETEMSVLASDVDNQAQQIKKDAAAAGVEVKASSFERQPDGTELAQMTFRLPMSKYPAFVESVKKLGQVESLTVRRDDRPDQTRTDDTAPAEVSLRLHNQGDIVADNHGLWATLRQTFGEGTAALFGSVRVIGVVIAFLAPWVFTLVLLAWVGRRIYIWRKK
jgi:autotransporter-associated beta strand protein